MTVRELMQQLSELCPEASSLVTGYESGFAPCTLNVVEVKELARGDDQAYLGRSELTEEAQRQAAEDPRSWAAMVDVPRLVGQPFTAVVLSRKGR